jgi:hypothetical protein
VLHPVAVRTPIALLALLLGVGLLVVPADAAVAPEAEEVQRAERVPFADEAWFLRFRQPVPDLPEEVPDPTGGFFGVGRAEIRARTNPFPIDTLHVGVLAGEPFARTFLGLSTFDVTDAPASIVGGTVTLIDNEEDSFNAASADMVACLATDLVVTDDAGDWESQPGFDCDVMSDVALVEGSAPLTWEIDLAPFADAFADELSPGIAVVEQGAAEGEGSPDPRATWQVSFDATVREEATLIPDGTALIGELERLLRTVTDAESLLGVVGDPASLPTFIILQALPDTNALYEQSRVLRQTDPDRSLRPGSADLEFVEADLGFGDGIDLGGDGAVDGGRIGDGAEVAAGDDRPAPFDPGPAATGGGFSSGGGGDVGSSSPVPSSAAPAIASDAGTAAVPSVGGDEPAVAEADGDPADVAAPQTATAEDAGADVPISGPSILLLLPLALGLAGALGWSLQAPAALPDERSGGALDRLMARRG